MYRPKVSVVIPCYNVEKYLHQCLESVVHQTLQDIEIICINDGSTDSTLDILREYESKDSRIKVISKPNAGYGHSMNVGIAATTGEYIGIVESDDFIELNMFEELYNIAKENDLDLARCQYYHYSGINDTNEIFDNSWVSQNEIYCPLENQIPFYQAPAIWCNIFKKNVIDKYNIRFLETPGASYQDTSFAFKLYACATRFMMISSPLIHYRIDNENSSVNSLSKAFFVNEEYKEIETFSKRIGIYQKVRKMIPKIKYGCYRWNHERLIKNLKTKFLLKMSKEYFKDFVNGNIDKTLFTKKEYRRIKTIAFFPWLYAFRRSL